MVVKKQNQKSKKQKVLLAMSGGVDSSVAGLLLKKQGYDVVGAFMKNWSDTKDLLGKCAWRGERKFALKVASMLEIPLITLDFEKQYKKQVVEEMFNKYKKGITPNPDIDCNQKIKFPLLIEEAKKRGIDLVATGHFARVKKNSRTKKYELFRGKDESKDQSYFLYRLSQNDLKHCLFPVGEYSKEKVRKIAYENDFPNYDKKSTVGICFIGKVNLKDFLKQRIKPKKGKILNPSGEIIGEHDGIYYYTIGQRLGPRYGFDLNRKSLGDEKPGRWYVVKKDLKKNVLVSAPEGHELNFRKEIFVNNLHLIDLNKKDFLKKKNLKARIRHVGELLSGKLALGKSLKFVLKKSITGVSEGQAIVFYSGKKCLGGGEISFK